MNLFQFFVGLALLLGACAISIGQEPALKEKPAQEEQMDKAWGKRVVKLRAADAKRGQLFDEGNYAMFIHWGLYAQLVNKVDGKTYYGIGEWIKHKNMAEISVEDYKELAKTFNPVKFDAKEIVQLAKRFQWGG